MDFSGQHLLQKKLQKLSLEGGSIRESIFEECTFEACTIINCKFDHTKFLSCEFKDSVLSAVIPLDSRFLEVGFKACKVLGMDWTKALEIRDLSFAECQLNFSNFRFLKLAGLKISHCQVKDSDFTEADLSGADFRSSDLENTRFFKTNLTGADFRGALNYRIDVANNSVKKARFSLPEAVALLKGLDINID
jgi:fluoroquinolone resistance protein